jgi:hypothetical protein
MKSRRCTLRAMLVARHDGAFTFSRTNMPCVGCDWAESGHWKVVHPRMDPTNPSPTIRAVRNVSIPRLVYRQRISGVLDKKNSLGSDQVKLPEQCHLQVPNGAAAPVQRSLNMMAFWMVMEHGAGSPMSSARPVCAAMGGPLLRTMQLWADWRFSSPHTTSTVQFPREVHTACYLHSRTSYHCGTFGPEDSVQARFGSGMTVNLRTHLYFAI